MRLFVQAKGRLLGRCLKSLIIGKFPVGLQPRGVGCSKRLTVGRPVKVSFREWKVALSHVPEANDFGTGWADSMAFTYQIQRLVDLIGQGTTNRASSCRRARIRGNRSRATLFARYPQGYFCFRQSLLSRSYLTEPPPRGKNLDRRV